MRIMAAAHETTKLPKQDDRNSHRADSNGGESSLLSCHQCHRQYERMDHLKRHLQSRKKPSPLFPAPLHAAPISNRAPDNASLYRLQMQILAHTNARHVRDDLTEGKEICSQQGVLLFIARVIGTTFAGGCFPIVPHDIA